MPKSKISGVVSSTIDYTSVRSHQKKMFDKQFGFQAHHDMIDTLAYTLEKLMLDPNLS